MGYCIRIEDLTANAFIESLKKSDKRVLALKDIEDYGSRVVKLLNENGEKAKLVLSREKTSALFHDYSAFFVKSEIDGKRGIRLQDGVNAEKLIKQFRGYLSLNVLLAFINERCVSVL